jgi:hypothetical protein
MMAFWRGSEQNLPLRTFRPRGRAARRSLPDKLPNGPSPLIRGHVPSRGRSMSSYFALGTPEERGSDRQIGRPEPASAPSHRPRAQRTVRRIAPVRRNQRGSSRCSKVSSFPCSLSAYQAWSSGQDRCFCSSCAPQAWVSTGPRLRADRWRRVPASARWTGIRGDLHTSGTPTNVRASDERGSRTNAGARSFSVDANECGGSRP